jgi:hypothetical protein
MKLARQGWVRLGVVLQSVAQLCAARLAGPSTSRPGRAVLLAAWRGKVQWGEAMLARRGTARHSSARSIAAW